MCMGTLTEEIFKCQNPLGLVIHTDWCIIIVYVLQGHILTCPLTLRVVPVKNNKWGAGRGMRIDSHKKGGFQNLIAL